MKVDDRAKCRKGTLHDFEVSRNLKDATIEVCRFCSEKRIYNKVGGRINNAQYARDHIRDLVQPFGKTKELFEKLYPGGHKRAEKIHEEFKNKKSKKQDQEEWEYLRKKITREAKQLIV